MMGCSFCSCLHEKKGSVFPSHCGLSPCVRHRDSVTKQILQKNYRASCCFLLWLVSQQLVWLILFNHCLYHSYCCELFVWFHIIVILIIIFIFMLNRTCIFSDSVSDCLSPFVFLSAEPPPTATWCWEQWMLGYRTKSFTTRRSWTRWAAAACRYGTFHPKLSLTGTETFVFLYTYVWGVNTETHHI